MRTEHELDISIKYIPNYKLDNRDNLIFGIISSKSADAYYLNIIKPLLNKLLYFKRSKIGTKVDNIRGLFNILTKDSYVFGNKKLSLIIVHEKYSHGTDNLLLSTEFYPTSNYKEGRATMNEFRKLIYDLGYTNIKDIRNFINRLSNKQLLISIREVNNYGKEMTLYDIPFLRYSLMYLP